MHSASGDSDDDLGMNSDLDYLSDGIINKPILYAQNNSTINILQGDYDADFDARSPPAPGADGSPLSPGEQLHSKIPALLHEKSIKSN